MQEHSGTMTIWASNERMWTYLRSKARFRWIANLLSSAHLSSSPHQDRWIRTAGERRRKCAQMPAAAPRRSLSWSHPQDLPQPLLARPTVKVMNTSPAGPKSRTHAMRCWINRSGDVTRNDALSWAANWSELVALCMPQPSGIQNGSRNQINISFTTN